MKNFSLLTLVRIALVGATYAALTMVLAPISYGPLQVRIAEVLTVLPFLEPSLAWGLFIGCLGANIYGGLGLWDIFGGSFLTLLAAFLTSRMPRSWLAPLPPVIINALGVSAYLHLLITPPRIALPLLQNLSSYWLFVITIGVGEFIAAYVLGLPLLFILMQRGKVLGFPAGKKRN